jgi:hypothetical protein
MYAWFRYCFEGCQHPHDSMCCYKVHRTLPRPLHAQPLGPSSSATLAHHLSHNSSWPHPNLGNCFHPSPLTTSFPIRFSHNNNRATSTRSTPTGRLLSLHASRSSHQSSSIGVALEKHLCMAPPVNAHRISATPVERRLHYMQPMAALSVPP